MTYDDTKKEVILEIENLDVDFPVAKSILKRKREYVSAVKNVSLKIEKGNCVAIVGESGCGKTTLANTMIGLVSPTQGTVKYRGKDIYKVSKSEYKEIRTRMQLIFQDPYSSMNPRFTVRDIIAEPYKIRKNIDESQIDFHVIRLLETVGLDKADMDRHIYNFSGGQRQRIAIARAIALNPEFLICDEPVSALDVSIHAQILNLLIDLQKELNLTYLFISHNLAVIRNISNYVAVMYLGEIVEYGEVDDIFNNPIHPYTKALLSTVKDTDPIILDGEIASPINPPSGCRFSTRCYNVIPSCHEIHPTLLEIEKGHFAACNLVKPKL